MTIDTSFHPELVHPTVFLADGVQIMGRVTIGELSSVWYNAVIRGDTENIRIGSRTNIQDLALLHADAGKPCTIGNDVTLGHAAIVHGATIEDEVMIGIRATVLNDAVIGRGSLIAAGCLVPERTVIPPNSVVMGMPGKVVRECATADRERIQYASRHYVEVAASFREQE